MEAAQNQAQLSSALPRLWSVDVPSLLQAETSECGLTCLAMIAHYHGKKIDMRQLRAQFSISSHGANLRDILTIAGKLSLKTRALKLDLDSLQELSLPCIIHWDMNHYVVLSKVTSKFAIVNDPAIGKRKLKISDFADHFTGIAVECSPTESFEPEKASPALTLWHFFRSATGLKRFGLILFSLSLLLQIFAMISPYYMQLIVDDVLVGKNSDMLTVLALGFGLLLLIEVATHTFRQFLMLTLTSRLNEQLSANVFYKLIHLPFDFFYKRHLGDVVSRFGSLGPIRNMLSQGLISAILDGLMAIITLIIMFVYSIKLAAISTGIIALYLLVKWSIYRPLHRLSTESLAASAGENTHFMESVRAIKTIKLFQQESTRQNEWQHKLVAYLNTDIALNRWQIFFDTLNKLLFGIENLVVIYFAATAVMNNVITVGMLYAFISYKTRFTSAIDNVINTIIDYRLLNVHFDRLSDLVLTPTENNVETHTKAIPTRIQPDAKSPLKINNLSYRYSPHSPLIFDNVCATINAGECIAITGPSGSGKTTLLHCLMGLLTPNSGNIQWQGSSIFNAPYRQYISAVMQDDHCLSGTILNNIACFDAEPDIQRVIWAAQVACIHTDIVTMPMQYQTLVGDMGSSLSGGQLQRILIARALYRRPQILFMDEATAHLDTESEKQVNANLRNCNVTRIIVAHRPQTIAMADKVYCLENGSMTLKTR
ncbi:peptidase domain-containing ABC transporter [Alteromonas sp. 5E99-2]|uniref:peptidase domain-containing ABC transporter n=1 Tax=Alteromonas sp. 5E99-2 TaxID=2817683 RepID=UPI001A9907EC|nr:peptidase domain-containing ABC transporter [Alteromonas sp. 5E99-2]MBO1256939.1 peptidase domain-containing ABC transporter [Alteromonas sp. 5E99-2]